MKRVIMMAMAVCMMTGLLNSCAMFGTKKPHLSISPTIPAATGNAKFKKSKNGNISIDLTVQHLANPEKLAPPATAYVVWVKPDQYAVAQNIGALVVDKNLNGELKTITPLRQFDLFVTAEGSSQTQTPSGEPLIWTSYNN